MPPVGNDVVDLRHPDNQGRDRDDRFLDRVFTAEERGLIAGAERPGTFLWVLWAAKEAAYKVVARGDPAVSSTPRKYAIRFDPGYEYRTGDGAGIGVGPVAPVGQYPFRSDHFTGISATCLAGRAITPRGELALRVTVTDDYVHALSAATKSDLDIVYERVDPMDVGEDPGEASGFVRKQLLSEIARCLDCPVGELSVGKEPLGPGAPFVLRRGQPLASEISLSHDGRFAAFAFVILKTP